MPIIIDNSLLQEPNDDPSPLEAGLLGLVEGIGAGIDQQRKQQAELDKFNREKAAQVDLLTREQDFRKAMFNEEQKSKLDMFNREMEANKPLRDLNIEKAKLDLAASGLNKTQAELELEATKNMQRQQYAVDRNRWATAFGNGDASKGEATIKTIEDRIELNLKQGTPEGAANAEKLRQWLTATGEQKHSEYQNQLSQNYIDKITSSELFNLPGNEGLAEQAQVVQSDQSLSPIQKADAIRKLEGQAKAVQFNIKRSEGHKMSLETRKETLLKRKALDASGPEEDYELQCQIDDINDALISISTIAPDDIDGLTDAINSSREMIYQTGRQSAARRSGTSSRSSDEQDVMKSLKDRVDLIAQFEANGQLTPDQAKAAYGAVWAMATPLLGMGGTAQAKQAGGGEGIMRDVMGEGSGGNQPPVPDIAGMTPEDMNKEVLALNEKESSKGLSVAESARRDALYKSMTLQQSGNARDRDIGKFVDETYSMLKTIYIPDEITKKHGKANKFSIKSISNRSDAETVLGHLTSLFDEIDRKLSERTSSRYNVDLADQAKLFKSRSELEKAKQAVARMINSNFYPAAKAKPATVQ